MELPEGNFIVCAQNRAGSAYAYEVIRRQDKSVRPSFIAKITANAVNSYGFKTVKEQLTGELLMIEDAAELSDESFGGIDEWLMEDSADRVVLIDTKENISGLLKNRPGMMKHFPDVLEYKDRSAGQWMEMAETYVEEQDCVLSEDAKQLVREYIDDRKASGKPVFGLVIADALDTAMLRATKSGLFRRPKTDESNRTLILDKHFE